MKLDECLRRSKRRDHLAAATTIKSMKRAMADNAIPWRKRPVDGASKEQTKTDLVVAQAREALAGGKSQALRRAVKKLETQPNEKRSTAPQTKEMGFRRS